jgi:hypothetical protein
MLRHAHGRGRCGEKCALSRKMHTWVPVLHPLDPLQSRSFKFNINACNLSHNCFVHMNKVILSFIVLNVIGFAVAQNTVFYTTFSDTACATKGPPPVDQGIANPLSIPVNSCVLWNNVPGNLQYIKFAPCQPSTAGTGYLLFTDKALCDAATASQLTGQTVMGNCVPNAGSGSSKYTCPSSASSISFSLLFLVAPLLAFCL